MNNRTDFDKLLAEEEFQQGIIHFDSLNKDEKRAFIKQYSINKDEFIKARTIIGALNFKEINFSEQELDYLWQRTGIANSANTLTQKLQTTKIINWFSKVAAILFIPLIITSIWFFGKSLKQGAFDNEKFNQLTQIYNTVSAPTGGRTKAVLPDGSEVWLNSGSSIQYPVLSKEEYREVKLIGEGFFKVTKNKEKPMLVTTTGMQVKVYGTTFNIKAYEDDLNIETALVEGKISIIRLNEKGESADTEYQMKPGELSILNKQNNTVGITAVNNMEVFTGWVNERYVFKNTRFKEILERLERIHNIEFVLEDKTLGEYNFDATFEGQNIDRIMEIFAISLPIKWKSIQAEQNNDNTYSSRKIIISRDKTKELQ